jgi:hypothetical protein
MHWLVASLIGEAIPTHAAAFDISENDRALTKLARFLCVEVV